MNFEKYLKDYAHLIIHVGINQQKGKPLVINSSIENVDFVRLLAKEAYEAGANEVIVNWTDDTLSRLRFNHAPMDVLENFPQWKVDFYLDSNRRDAAYLSITSEDPDRLKGIDTKKISAASKASSLALQEYHDALMADRHCWCVVAAAGEKWAQKVFPGLSSEEAVERLWQEIFEINRIIAEDPAAAWKEHLTLLEEKTAWLNDCNFHSLHYTNSLGTDLTIELPKGHQWLGGAGYSTNDVYFVANMPTEEVFTLPHRDGVNGVVYSSKPLVYQGNLIEDFYLVFEKGRVVEYEAKKGEEYLKQIFDIDEKGRYLGEVALVPYDSPISKRDFVFYTTLFDENASCHLALGQAYPTSLKDGDKMSKEELKEAGVNDALVHVDFMVGTADLDIVGETWDGKKIPVFKNGNWA